MQTHYQKGLISSKTINSISLNHINSVHSVLSGSTIGFRVQPGTELRNDQTGETVYIPPQDHGDILRLMSQLESFTNNQGNDDLDPLVRMALIHHQFESIHPFPDGNGRTGRIVNILCLVLEGLIDIPILYLSRFITTTKQDYYRLLQSVRDTGNWEEWILYILEGSCLDCPAYDHPCHFLQNPENGNILLRTIS